MKKILTSIILLAAIFGCEENVRIPEFQNAPNVRVVIATANSYFDFDNLSTAKLVYDIYSEDYSEIESVVFRFRYQKNGSAACNLYGCLGPYEVKTYTAADLTASKGKILADEITIQDCLAAMGLTLSDITGGDQFYFENITTMKDGRVYPTVTPGGTDNVPAIFDTPGAHYSASWSAIVGCPIPAAFTGNYSLTQISGPLMDSSDPASGPAFANQTVTLAATNPITRTFTLTYFGFTGRPFRMILLCDDIIVPKQYTNLACSSAIGLWWETDVVPGTYNPSNHTTFDIKIIENVNLDCGEPATPTVLRLTRI